MINQLQQHLVNNKHQLALSLLTHPKFFHSVFNPQIQSLVKLVQRNHPKYPSSTLIAIYTIIIIKPHNISYNHKIAIQTLTKIYRQPESYKEIIAGLLIRIPTFSNHRMIVCSVSPLYISNDLMKHHGVNFRKQSSNLFEARWCKFKVEWDLCGNEVLQRELGQQISGFKELLVRIRSEEQINGEELKNIINSIQKQQKYLEKRIRSIKQEKINIDLITSSITQILKIQTLDIKTFNKDIILNRLIYSQNFTLRLTNLFLLTFQKRLLRKIKWFHDLIIEGLSTIINTDLKQWIKLLNNYYCVFGEGALNVHQVFFTAEWSVLKIVEGLSNIQFQASDEFYNNKSNIRNLKKEDGKLLKEYLQNILNNSENHYESYLKKISKQGRNKIMGLCLQIYLRFYGSSTHYKGAEFLSLIDNSYNKLTNVNQIKYYKIKQTLFSKAFQIKPNLQYFCEDIFYHQISPSLHQNNQKILSISSQFLFSINPNPFSIKKTDSYSLQSIPKDNDSLSEFNYSKKSKDKSQMFYSIKSRTHQYHLEDHRQSQLKQTNQNAKVLEAMEEVQVMQGILTPQF